MQPQTLAGEILPDARHGQIAAILPTEFFGQRVAKVPGCICAPTHFFEQRFPVLAGQTASIPVRARVLAAVVKEADVVILCLERLDLALDEVIEYDEVILDGLGDIE